jgi:hypothetical protein
MTILKRLGSLLRGKRPVIRNLELHVSDGCNLSCESCSHYSNHAHASIVSLAQADRWMGRARLLPAELQAFAALEDEEACGMSPARNGFSNCPFRCAGRSLKPAL